MEETEQFLINKEATPSLFVGNVRELWFTEFVLKIIHFRYSKKPTRRKPNFVKL